MKSFLIYRDSKVTTWFRETFRVDAETLEEALDSIANDNEYAYDGEYLSETDEWLTPNDNGGEPTEEYIYQNETVRKNA